MSRNVNSMKLFWIFDYVFNLRGSRTSKVEVTLREHMNYHFANIFHFSESPRELYHHIKCLVFRLQQKLISRKFIRLGFRKQTIT